MPLKPVPAVVDGDHIQWLEPAPMQGAYRVLVTFVEPVTVSPNESTTDRFWASFGAWRDDAPVESTLATIRDARRSRPEPPSL
jgi:hypothetical protein